MRRNNPLRRLSLGRLIFLLCGLHLLLTLPLVLCNLILIDDDFSNMAFGMGIFNATILVSVWIGLGGRVSPWRLVVLVLTGLLAVWLLAEIPSTLFQEVPVVLFILMLTISSVFLTLRFFGCQLRRVRHAKQLLARRKRIRQHRVEGEKEVAAKRTVQFTLRGMLSWTAAFALVMGSLRTLWPVFKDSIGPIDHDFILMLGWFALFSPVALWLACGIRFLLIRIIVYVSGTWIIVRLLGDSQGFAVVLCLWIWMVFLLVRLGGFRFLRVAPNPIHEDSPRPSVSA